MLKARVMPCLLLHDGALVKTVRYEEFNYIGEPINTVRIFNELEVDELILLDILATRNRVSPDFELISQIASECFMPLTYGGGISNVEDAKQLFNIGIEKIVINSQAFLDHNFISELSNRFGSQSIVASIDVNQNMNGSYTVANNSGIPVPNLDPIEWAAELERMGAGEIFLTSIQHEGTWKGYDIPLISSLTSRVDIPVIANGGAGSVADIGKAINEGGAAGAATGSMVVFQKKNFGVLVHFPPRQKLDNILS